MGIRPVWPHSTRQNSVGIQASIQQIFDQSQCTLRRTYVINSYMVYKMSFKFFYEGVNRAFKKIDANNQLSIQGCLGLKSKPSIECRPETAKELCQSPIMASYLILISSCGGRKGGGGHLLSIGLQKCAAGQSVFSQLSCHEYYPWGYFLIITTNSGLK